MATSVVETITPERARNYLAKSGGNRNISKPVVESYAHTMREGKWLLNGEPIVFDANGVLLNGHHRLHAVIKADTPIMTFVVRGVEHESYTTFDCGRHRTVGQLIGMQGIKHYNAVASSVQLAYRLANGYQIGEAPTATKRIGKTNADMIEYFNTDRELFIQAAQFATELRNYCPILDQSIVGGTYHYLIRNCFYEKDTVEYFFREICSYDSSKVNILDLMRIRLLRNKQDVKTRMQKSYLYALLIKTWNAFVTGKGDTAKCLKFDTERDEYPEFIKNKQ